MDICEHPKNKFVNNEIFLLYNSSILLVAKSILIIYPYSKIQKIIKKAKDAEEKLIGKSLLNKPY